MIIAMLLFSLTMSLSPGPVNLLILNAGSRHGVAPTLPFVGGATLGFTALLALVGHVLAGVMNDALLQAVLGGLGSVFVVYMGWRIATASGNDGLRAAAARPSFLQGWVLQWVNPKAWVACAAGVAMFASPGRPAALQLFIAVYCVVCYASLLAWAVFGRHIGRWLTSPDRLRRFNLVMGGSLMLSAVLPLLR